MNKELLQATFREWKKAAKADYAITNPNSLGDCMSCVNYTLSSKYGENSKGIWAKHGTSGMNKSRDLASPKEKSVYIAHDITEEQAKLFYEVFGKSYNIVPEEYNPSKCFEIFEKSTKVWRVSWSDTWQGRTMNYDDRYADFDEARYRMQGLVERGLKVSVEELFRG